MATKRYNQQNFYIELTNGNVLSFYCWTTDTRNGFCHTCWCSNTDQTSKVSYYNRTWESYDYQSVLLNAFRKLPKSERLECELWDTHKVNKEHLECENFVNAFKAVYEQAPQSLKDVLAKSDVEIHNKAEANNIMSIMKMATLLQK